MTIYQKPIENLDFKFDTDYTKNDVLREYDYLMGCYSSAYGVHLYNAIYDSVVSLNSEFHNEMINDIENRDMTGEEILGYLIAIQSYAPDLEEAGFVIPDKETININAEVHIQEVIDTVCLTYDYGKGSMIEEILDFQTTYEKGEVEPEPGLSCETLATIDNFCKYEYLKDNDLDR